MRTVLLALVVTIPIFASPGAMVIPLEVGIPKGVAFSKNGRFLAVINAKDELSVHDAQSGIRQKITISLRHAFGHVFGRNNLHWHSKGWHWWSIDETFEISDDGNLVTYLYSHPERGSVPNDLFRESTVATSAFLINMTTRQGLELPQPENGQLVKKISLAPRGNFAAGITNFGNYVFWNLNENPVQLETGINFPPVKNLGIFYFSPLAAHWKTGTFFDFPASICHRPPSRFLRNDTTPTPLQFPEDLNPEAVALSDDLRFIAVTEGSQGQVFALDSLTPVITIPSAYQSSWSMMRKLGSAPEIQRLAFSPDHKMLGILRKSAVQILAVPSGELIAEELLDSSRAENSIERSYALTWVNPFDLAVARADHAEIFRLNLDPSCGAGVAAPPKKP